MAPGAAPLHAVLLLSPTCIASSAVHTCEFEVAQPIARATLYPPAYLHATEGAAQAREACAQMATADRRGRRGER